MTTSTALAAAPREVIGKASKKLAPQGKIPGVLYGGGREPLALTLDRHEFDLFVSHHATGSTIVELKIEGVKKPINAMIREVQRSAVKGAVLHVDLLEVSMDQLVHAVVTMHLVNDPAGVKAGGVLTVNLHELNVEAKPGDLPDALEHDVSALEVGDTLNVGEIAVPAGVTLLDDPSTVIASVTAPTIEEEPEVEEGMEEEDMEPELIGESTEAPEEE